MNCFRFFGFKSLDEVDRLTVREYDLLCEAEQYRLLDKQKDIALTAWLGFLATAKKQVGKRLKPVYPTFQSFFDYSKELRKLKGDSVNELKERYKDLHERLDTIKLLEENTARTLFDINCSKIFLDPPPRVTKIKTKINKRDLIKPKSLCTAKETINKTNGQPSEWKKILANEITDKVLISKIYKQLMQLHIKKTQTTQPKN